MADVTKINLKEIQTKLYESLIPSGWGVKLKVFLLSEEFHHILQTLYDQSKSGIRFTPQIKHLFRFLEECPYNKLNVVFMGQDPYPGIYEGITVADGISFSCRNTRMVQPSLRYMFKEIEETVYPLEGYEWDPDLTRWANQGVLMMNTALTTSINKVGSHYELWKPFIEYLFDVLAFGSPNIIYVFCGKKAKEWEDSVPNNNFKITCTHPASAAHNSQEKWDSGDLFNRINIRLYSTNGYKIKW